MEIDSLVKVIVGEVLKKIEEETEMKERKILFLEPESEEIKLKYSLFISDWNEIYFIGEEVDGVEDYDLIICPQLTIKDLVDIANGKPGSKISSTIIEAILHGVEIICLEEGMYYRKFENSSNEVFYSMMIEYEKRLLEYGVKIIKCSQLKNSLNNIYVGNNLLLKEEKHIDKKVVTQSDIEKLLDNGYENVSIKKENLITPLAEDYIKTNHIDIKKV